MHKAIALLMTFVAAGCGARSTQSAGPDSSSHWLSSCSSDADCGGVECLCGRCTTNCDDNSGCESLAGSFAGFDATCIPVTGCGSDSICQITCEEDDDCPSEAS